MIHITTLLLYLGLGSLAGYFAFLTVKNKIQIQKNYDFFMKSHLELVEKLRIAEDKQQVLFVGLSKFLQEELSKLYQQLEPKGVVMQQPVLDNNLEQRIKALEVNLNALYNKMVLANTAQNVVSAPVQQQDLFQEETYNLNQYSGWGTV